MKYTSHITNNATTSGLERSLGPTQAHLLLTLAERFGASFTSEQAHGDPSIQDPHLKGRLNDLLTKGWLFSLGRGAYMIAPLEAGPDSSAYAINRYLAAATIAGDRDYYLSYRTAMELHGMTLHPWRSVYLSTASRLRSREIQHYSIQPVTVAPDRLWGAVPIEVIPDHRVNVSSRARTIVDCIDRPGYAGGLADVALGITLLGEGFVATDAVTAALRFGRISVIKRMGVLIELLAPEQGAAVQPLLQHVDRTPHVLDPQSPRGGRLNSRWGIWMNISEDELLQETES